MCFLYELSIEENLFFTSKIIETCLSTKKSATFYKLLFFNYFFLNFACFCFAKHEYIQLVLILQKQLHF